MTDRDIEIKNETSYEVGLFDMIISIRKPMCEKKEIDGQITQTPANIQAYLSTDPLKKFSTEKMNF